MSAQPLAPPATDLEILESLDFEPAVPCESLRHQGDGPAVYLLQTLHRCGCPSQKMTVCASCWDVAAQPPNHWHCATCNAHMGTRDETWTILCTIGGAS
jgi:hypothetical protein